MPTIPVTEGIKRLEELRTKNPQLSSLSNVDLASLANRQRPDPRLQSYLEAGTTQRLFGEGAVMLEGLGKKYTGPAAKAVASPFVGEYGQKVAERVGEGLPRFAVDLIPQLVSSRLKPISKISQVAPLAATALTEYGLTKAETGSSLSAAGSAVSVPLSALGANKVGEKAVQALGKEAGPLIKKLVGAAGNAVGGVPGDVLEIGTSDPSKGFVENLKGFVNDPVSLGAYGVQAGVFGVGMDMAHSSGEVAKSERDAYLRKLTSLNETFARDNYEELARLLEVPESLRTEQQDAQIKSMRSDLRKYEDFQLRDQIAQESLKDWSTVPESFETLKEQYKMLTSGQRPLMMVPKGSEWSSRGLVPMDMVNIEGNKFFYNRKLITPDAIKAAYDNKQLGTLLGYGTETPVNATEAVVLRNAQGTEKLAVEVDEASKPTVLKSLEKYKLADDRLGVEPKVDVVKQRLKNRTQMRLFSLRTEQDLPENTVFTVQMPDKEAKIPGYVQVDFFDPATGTNTRSSNVRSLQEEGYRIPKLPKNLTTGQYTLEQLRSMGGEELPLTPSGGIPLFSVFSQKNEYFWNSLLRKAEQAFTPRIRNWNGGTKREKGARFTPDPDGRVGSKGLSEFVQQAVPSEIYAHLQERGLSEVLKAPKVSVEEFVKWVRENAPEVEVKKLEPFQLSKADAATAQAQHRLESQGFTVNEFGRVFEPHAYGGKEILEITLPEYRDYGNNTLSDIDYVKRNHPGKRVETDAATGKYGVEPISVDKMDRPVDILVRVPLRDHFSEKTGKNIGSDRSFLYKGPHFGDSDVNVVASVRGYFSDPQTFNVFEVQSDWGQARRKDEKMMEEYKATGPALARTKDHPLLRSYETIALKTAIRHALENGATRIVLADGQTVSMIEQHDLYANTLNIPGEPLDPPSQYRGMVQHYDKNLPSILNKLTNSTGKPIDLGPMDREASPYFKDSTGQPKINQTGRVWSLDNLKPEVYELFSFYNTDKQISFENALAATRKAFEEGTPVSTQEFLSRITQGENVDNEILLKYVNRIRDNPGVLRTFALDSIDGMAIRGYSEGGLVGVNTAKAANNVAFGTLVHELSHTATHRYAESHPEFYKQTHDWVNAFKPEERLNILRQLADAVGVKDVDLEYGAGIRFAQDEPELARKSTYEFVGTVSELLARAAYDKAKLPTLFKYLQWLPSGVYQMVVNAWRYMRSYFSPGTPSMVNVLSETASRELNDTITKVNEIVARTEGAEAAAQVKLQGLKAFDPSVFVEHSTEDFAEPFRNNVESLGSGAFRDLSVKWLEENEIGKKVRDAYENSFLSPLFRSRLYPQLAGIFHETRNYRNNIKELMHGYFSFLGQNKDKSLTYAESLLKANELIDNLVKPNVNRSARFNRINSVFEENQKRRQQTLDAGFQTVAEDKLVTRDEMISTFGMSEADADLTEKLVKLPQLVMKEVLRMQQETDAAYTAKLIVSQNKKLDPKEALRRATALTMQAGESGMTRFRRQMYEKIVAEQMKAGNDEPWVAELADQITALKANEVAERQSLEMNVRQVLGDVMQLSPELGKDGFVNQLVEFSLRLGAIRAQNTLIAKDAGYAPTTRRGRYLLRVYRTDVLGYELGLLRGAFGFDSKEEVDNFIAKQKLNKEEFEVLDKSLLEDRYKMYTPRSLQSVRLKAQADLRGLVDELVASAGEAERPKMAQVLDELLAQYKPLESEIREIIAVKGDKFAQRRYNIEGFDKNDFLPNIMEYMNYKTVKAVKERTRARVALELERPEFDADMEMRRRTEQEVDYTLNNTNEWAGLRKLVLNWYLGASPRHFIQNMFQIPMTGIPQLIAEGAGVHAYGHFMNALKMGAKYLTSGKTGDETLDIMLKEAERGGVTIPNAIEMFAPQTDRIQSALDSLSAYEKGTKFLGDHVDYYASRFMDSFGRVMQSTASASEIANRRIAFIMSYLESKRTGVSDTKMMYDKAARFADFTNFVGDKSNRPGFLVRAGFDSQGNPSWTHGPLLTATSMQSFVLNSIGQMYSFAKRAAGGHGADKAALMTATAHLLIAAGGFGLIGAATAEQVFESLTGISLREAIRRKLVRVGADLFDSEEFGGRAADGLMYGLPGFLGIDASQSLGLGSPLVNYNADRPMGVLEAAGPLGGLIQKGIDASSILTQNAWNWDTMQRAARVAAPQALNYWLRNLDNLNASSYYDRRGQPVVNDMGVEESAALASGFTPMRVTREREFQGMLKKNRDRLSQEYQNSTRTIAAYLKQYETTGDDSYRQKAQGEFTKFIRSVPAQDRGTMVAAVTKQLQEFRAPVGQAPTMKELPGYQEASSTYPGEVLPQSGQLSSLLDELKVSQSLGQPLVTAQKLQSLRSTFLTKLLSDLLTQGGLPRPVSRAFLQARTQTGLRSLIGNSLE